MAFLSALVASSGRGAPSVSSAVSTRLAFAASGWPSTSPITGTSAARDRFATANSAHRERMRRVMVAGLLPGVGLPHLYRSRGADARGNWIAKNPPPTPSLQGGGELWRYLLRLVDVGRCAGGDTRVHPLPSG